MDIIPATAKATIPAAQMPRNIGLLHIDPAAIKKAHVNIGAIGVSRRKPVGTAEVASNGAATIKKTVGINPAQANAQPSDARQVSNAINKITGGATTIGQNALNAISLLSIAANGA